MKSVGWSMVGLVLLTAAAHADVQGDYVESRSCSVFAGACHYGGEYDNEGRDAIMAWHFTQGDYRGVPLAGVSAVAVVRADRNLAEPDANPSATLYVSPEASAAQVAALKSLIEYPVDRVVCGPIQFDRTSAGTFLVQVSQAVALRVSPLPDRACCLQPNLVWYQPLTKVQHRLVGLTEAAVAPDWSRHHENGSFYGTVQYR